jgi:hypothetical protein
VDTNTEYTAGTGLDLTGTEFSADASLATDTEVTAAVAASAALDLDKVIGNESVTGLTFDGTTLTLAQDGGANRTVALNSVNTDNQDASEVDSDSPVDVDGDGTSETNVEAVIQAIAPITSKAARVFYPPSIAIDASVTGTFTVDLYAQYIAQFGSPVVSSGGSIPTYGSGELDYHVTYADPAVFNTGTMAISPAGVLTYTVDAPPADYNSLINVVFVVK